LLTLLHQLTGGGLAGGLVLTADTAVFALLSPYAGTLADRLDRRRIIQTTEALSAGLALLLLLVDSRSTVWVAVLTVGALAAAKAIATPAAAAATPNLVAPEDLALASVMNGVAWGSMLAVGAALGGIGAAVFGTSACFVLDAVSFALSALLLSRCRTPFQQTREAGEHVRFREAVQEAVAFTRTDRSVLALLAVKPGVAFANGSLVLFPVLATEVFHAGATGTGLLYAARGLGALTGPLLLGSRGRDGPALWWTLAAAVSACGALYVLVALSPFFWLAVLLVALAHLGGGANWTVSTYGLQRRVPDRVLGRISSADLMLVTLVIALNRIVAGVLSEIVGTRLLIGCFGAASVAYAMVWLNATRSLRRSPLDSGD
jgi:MFS family permease